ncbi:stage V sporulation protein AE [Brevibacillus massiliensis]|jgi:stage V sporulation protein AE|uniref:stage V sporulation protein AE n=1 Tax=Brevibacillus massiliensis TaxID=1118054 RepID=UPI0003113690|nr:stage V sporulation protein AE [Brevibacillus massiliensis]
MTNGDYGRGAGEQAMSIVTRHPGFRILGVLAVASHTSWARGVRVDCSIDNAGRIVKDAVDKDGFARKQLDNRIMGDTVDILSGLAVPNVIGIGDIGKMAGRDSLRRGCPITRKAVEWILERSGHHAGRGPGETSDHP